MAPGIHLVLLAAIALLMITSIIELSFISSMVGWLHRRAGGDFQIDYNGTTFPLHGKPAGLLIDQGHTSNGAAGTAFIVIGLGGLLALWLRARASRSARGLSGASMFLYRFWLGMTVPSMLLTLAALIYTFVLTGCHDGQAIDLALAASLDNHPFPDYVAYPADQWTPEIWFTAVLALPLASGSDRKDITSHLRVMRGWRWNLIPMFITGLAVCLLAFLDHSQERRLLAKQKSLSDKDSSSN